MGAEKDNRGIRRTAVEEVLRLEEERMRFSLLHVNKMKSVNSWVLWSDRSPAHFAPGKTAQHSSLLLRFDSVIRRFAGYRQ